MANPEYDQAKFYAMCEELGRLMDIERASQAAREQARWSTGGYLIGSGVTAKELREAFDHATAAVGNMAWGMSRVGLVTAAAGVEIERFAEAIDPPKFVWMDESAEITSEQWNALERRAWQRRAHGMPLSVISTDGWQMRRLTRWETFLVDVMDASRGKRWLSWLGELALRLLMRRK